MDGNCLPKMCCFAANLMEFKSLLACSLTCRKGMLSTGSVIAAPRTGAWAPPAAE
jgi:hypothetical protein